MPDLKQLIQDNWDKKKFISLSLNKIIKNEIMDATSFLDVIYEKIPLRNRAYVILHDITKETLPQCKCGCQKPCALDVTNSINGFRSYATSDCSRKDKTVSKEALDLLKNKNWLYDQRIIQQKSIDLIAQELNISHVPVKKWLVTHEIDDMLDCRSRNALANQILQNKTELEKLYQSGLTCEQIAEKILSSRATVSKWLKFHEIETRNPNEYERKIYKVSNEEQELLTFIEGIYEGEIIRSNRSLLKGKKIDIYLPKLNLAIEYNGLYTHSYKPWEVTEALIKGPNYHLNKTINCSKQGIQLLHIFSDEWILKKEIVKSLIMNKLRLNKKIFARKCNIIEVKTHEKNIFLNQNHIQGEDKSKIKLGLVHDNVLVSVMTFCKSRFNRSYEWELSRFCSLLGYNIVGGFSKLLNYFRKNYSESIISYADRRYSIGGVYEKNGFELIRENKPNYYYVDKNYNKRYNRLGFQKNKISVHGGTEYERARDLGYNRIYDCGTLAYGFIQ